MVYMSEKKAMGLFEDCMDELYLASVPSISWHDIKRKYSGENRSELYLKHKIKSSVYDSIVSKYKKSLPKFYNRDFESYLLDYAPTSED